MAKRLAVVPAPEVAEDAAGLREAIRRPVIKRTVTERWDEDEQRWIPESKTSEVGIGPVGAVIAAVVAAGAVGAIAQGASEAARRRAAQRDAQQ